MRMLCGDAIHGEGCNERYDRRKGSYHIEHDVPIGSIDDHTSSRGANSRAEGHHDAEEPHREATALDREREHEHAHDHGHENTRAHCLNDTTREQYREIRPPSSEKRADREDRHREQEEIADRKAIDQKRGHGNHDGVHEREAGGEPLTCGGIDAHVDHDGRQRWRYHCLVEHCHERAH